MPERLDRTFLLPETPDQTSGEVKRTLGEVMTFFSADELKVLLDHTWPEVQAAAEKEAARRWRELVFKPQNEDW